MSKDTMGYTSSTVPQGSRVALIVSTGEAPRSTSFVMMPDIIGKSQGKALEEIARTSLQTQVVYDYHPTQKKGTVIASRPAPMTNALAGSDALVLISSGEPMGPRPIAPLPSVIGFDEPTALEEIKTAGLNAQVMYEPSATVPAGYVIDQLPNQRTYANLKKSGGKGKLWALIAAALLIIALAIAGFFMLGGMDRFAKEKVVVPDVVGMTEEQAVTALDEVGLTVGRITDVEATEEFSEPGTVVVSKPIAGEEVALGSKVDLDVVIDPSKVRADVPNVVGKTAEEAIKILEEAGFVVASEEVASIRVDAGKVVEQSPPAGTKSNKGANVLIRVSSGPGDIAVPSIIGLSEQTAKTQLTNAGLTFTTATSPSDAAKGTVISSSPAPGAMVKPGTSVALIISSGPASQPAQKITIPSYVGWNGMEAQRNLSEIGLIGVLSPPDGDGIVESSNPAAGTRVEKGSTVTLKVVTPVPL